MAVIRDDNSSVREALHSAVEEVAQSQETDQGQAEQHHDQPEVINAPDTWSDEDKTVFNKLNDPDARKWVLNRDKTYNDQITAFSTDRERLSQFDKIFEPHAERLKGASQEPYQVVDNLLKAQLVLETKPLEGIDWLIKNYGIDKQQLIAHLSGTAAPVKGAAPEGADELDFTPTQLEWINKRLQPLDQIVETQTEAQKRQREDIARRSTETTAAFRDEKDPKTQQLLRPHMANKEVADQMAKFIHFGLVPIVNGDVKSALEKAYDQACMTVDSVRDKYLAEKNAPKEEITNERLLKAKRAGVSVRGLSGSQASRQPTGSVRDHLKAGFQNAGMTVEN